MISSILNKARNPSRYYLLSILCYTLFLTKIMAQEPMGVSEYLQTIKEFRQLEGNHYKLYLLEELNYSLPLIKGLQLRTETRDFELNRQEYVARIIPNSIGAISKQRGLYQIKLQQAKLETDLRFNQQLEKRYFQIIDHLLITEMIDLTLEKKEHLMNKSKILKESMYNINFDITDLVSTEDQLLAIEEKLKNLKATRTEQLSEMKEITNRLRDSIGLNFDELIEPEEIVMNKKVFESRTEPLEVSLQKLKLNSMQKDLELSTAKSNQLLDYVQVKYEAANEFVIQENISVGIGFNINFGANRQRKGDYFFDKLNEEIKLASLKEEVTAAQNDNLFEFKEAIKKYIFVKNQIEHGSIKPIFDIYKNMIGVSPILLVKLKLLLNEKQTATVEAKHELYTSYIRTLSVQEILFQKPLRNYLSTSMNYIEP